MVFKFKAVETARWAVPAALNPVSAVFATHPRQGESPQAGRDKRPHSRPHPGLYGLQPRRGAPLLRGGQQDYHYPTLRVMAARGQSRSGSARYRSSPEGGVLALPPGARRGVGPCGAVYEVFKEREGLLNPLAPCPLTFLRFERIYFFDPMIFFNLSRMRRFLSLMVFCGMPDVAAYSRSVRPSKKVACMSCRSSLLS